MASLEELLALQEQTMNTIHRALPNLKKLGKSKWTLAIVKNRHFQLNQAFSKAQDLDAKINLLATETHRQSMGYFVSDLFCKCEDYFYEASDFIAEIISTFEAPSSAQAVPTVAARTTSHLPRISLPTYDGTLSAWENFRDQFQALIHHDATLSTFEKMHYLKASLTGDALRALSHLTVTEANYEIAWTVLTNRFENKRRLITEHLLSLLNLSQLQNEESQSLQEMRDTVNSALQALRNLNRPVDAWSDLVICLVTGKFDTTTFRAWETKTRDITDYPTYADLDTFLGTRIRILEAVSARSITPEPKPSKRIVSHTSALQPDDRKRNRSKLTPTGSSQRRCRICNGEHSIYRCPRFIELSVTQRLEAVDKHQLCTNCLSGAHFARECRSLFRCRTCRRRHHTLIHSDNIEASSSSADRSEPRGSPPIISSNFVAPGTSFPASVLLATARVKVCAPNGRCAVVRALLDQGSVATLISEPLAQALRLRRHRCSLRVAGINGAEATARHTAAISISSLLKPHQVYNTEVVILSSLTRYNPDTLRCPAQWTHTQGLQLAEPDPFSSDPIKLIIGTDLYGQILRDGMRRGNDREPIAQNTAFGWILSGAVPSTGNARILPSHHVSPVPPSWDLHRRFSSWPNLLRVTALIFRFVRRIRPPTKLTGSELDVDGNPVASRVYLRDLNQAKLYWLKRIQQDTFPHELDLLRAHKNLAASHKLSSLDPYLDNHGLLRVGGRLRCADIDHLRKHPIFFRAHPLVEKIIRHHHLLTLHGGSQLTTSSLRHEYWLLRARSTVRSVIHRCLPCVRERAAAPSELMGDLPSFRVNRTARAFIHTGVDYAGPIAIRTAPGRGHKSHKAYIAVFICMTVKAIHLELVSDYSSAAFLAAYHRFVSRRGVPVAMYSDNGTTFQGTDRELQATYAKSLRNPDLQNTLVTSHVQWHFLPPAAPHFGGLWEAGVKSVKHHLKRCIGSHTLTFEEMPTLLCRIEACLNSRPLAPVSESPDDYSALTPGHFLIGTPLIAPAKPSVLDVNEHRLNRWQMLQLLTETFWKSWSTDYLQVLQQRPKWRTVRRLAAVGRMVLIRNANTPPSQWELGRITECHPGHDDLTRVVTVKTSKSEYRRPIVKLCFLPVDINEGEIPEPSMAGGIRAKPDTPSTAEAHNTHISDTPPSADNRLLTKSRRAVCSGTG